MNETNISNKDIKNTPLNGITFVKCGSIITKPKKMVNTLWPANMLANNLTDREKGLAN